MSAPLAQRLSRVAPGLPELLTYSRADFPSDVIAGLSVAAVALPVGVAYAQLAGFRPEFGLYASILPLVAVCIVRNVPPVDYESGCGHPVGGSLPQFAPRPYVHREPNRK